MTYVLTFSNGDDAPFATEQEARRFAQEHLNPGESCTIEFAGERTPDNSPPMYERIVISFDPPEGGFNVTPDTFTEEAFRRIISPYIVAMRGIGHMLALLDDDSGWDQSNCFDFEPVEHLLDAAIDSLKSHAKLNNLFYNTVKLEGATTRAFVEAYGNAFISEKGRHNS